MYKKLQYSCNLNGKQSKKVQGVFCQHLSLTFSTVFSLLFPKLESFQSFLYNHLYNVIFNICNVKNETYQRDCHASWVDFRQKQWNFYLICDIFSWVIYLGAFTTSGNYIYNNSSFILNSPDQEQKIKNFFCLLTVLYFKCKVQRLYHLCQYLSVT